MAHGLEPTGVYGMQTILTPSSRAQANTTNWTTVKFWQDLGLERIILSRELRLKEIAEIHEKVPNIELE